VFLSGIEDSSKVARLPGGRAIIANGTAPKMRPGQFLSGTPICQQVTSSFQQTGLPRASDPGRDVGPARAFDAVIFDMDGVVTDTAAVHSAAWKQMFDEYLHLRDTRAGVPFREFTHVHDYRTYVDGRPRYQGVEAFLESRGIHLPMGTPDDPAGRETVCGLGNRKNGLFNEIIATSGVKLYATTLDLIHSLRQAGIKVGLATSSRNAAPVLEKTQTTHLFATVVDGLVSAGLSLKGKPHPDIFTTACAALRTTPARSVVVEDAVSGVRAGVAGGFGLVIGVAREDNAQELRENGADVVVRDLAEINVETIDRQVRRADRPG
jgi:beta-phosphoglucomutase family hydrolase